MTCTVQLELDLGTIEKEKGKNKLRNNKEKLIMQVY